MKALVGGLGWEWTGAADETVVATGRATGYARLRPVGRYEQAYVSGESYVEPAVPVAVAAPDAAAQDDAAQADVFRAAREAVTAALGKPSEWWWPRRGRTG